MTSEAFDGPGPPGGRGGPRDVGSMVRTHLPPALGEDMEPAGTGDFCIAYRTGEVIVRVARHAAAARAIQREACVLARIAERLPLEVPRLEYRAPEGCPPFTLHAEVVGTALSRAAWDGMPAPKRTHVAARLADFLQRLHALADEGRTCGVPEVDEGALARRLRAAARAQLDTLLAPSVARRLDELLAARMSHDTPRGVLALLHGDIAPGHLLYDETSGELTGVIDFGDVALGPPARDFIFLYEDFGVDRCLEVLAAYAGPDAVPLLEDVRAWYVLEAVSWTLERLAAGAGADVAHGLEEITRELSA